MLHRCPKCSGWLNPRSGYPNPIAWTCFNCGLTSESSEYLGADGQYHDIPGITDKTRHKRIGRYYEDYGD